MLKCVVFLCLMTIVIARSSSTSFNTISEPKNNSEPSTKEDESEELSAPSSIWDDFSYLYRSYKSCTTNDLSVCLKLKLVKAIDNASRSLKNVELMQGVKFVHMVDAKSDKPDTILSENEILNSLPRSSEARETALTSLMWEKVLSFFQSHTLQVKFPSEDEIERSLSEARHKKKKGKGAMIMIPLLLGGTMIPMAYGALALLAGKALIVSKLALVLASIIGIKKLVSSSGGHHESSHEVVVSGGHGGSGWGRDFDLAYNNQYMPKDKTQSRK